MQNDRITIPVTKYQKVMQWLGILALVGTFVLVLFSWNMLPDKIPGHYNSLGEVDRWGNKWEILIVPIISALMWAGISFMEKFPQIWNTGITINDKNKNKVYSNIKNMIVTLKAVLVLCFSYITFATIGMQGLGSWFVPVFYCATIIPMVYFLLLIIKSAIKK